MAGRDEVYDKPYAYEDADGRVVYRASSLGACTGALTRARLGVSGALPNDFMAERFQEGHNWEGRVLAAGLGEDWMQIDNPVTLGQWGRVVDSEAGVQVETELAWSNKVVRCHPDAIAAHRETLQPHVVEVKFLGPDMYDDIVFAGKMSEGYRWQMAIEMLSTGLPMLYIVGRKVISEDADGNRVVELGDVWTKVYELDDVPFSLKDVKARVLEVEGYVARGEVPACPVPFVYPCPYYADHEAREVEEIDNEVLAEWVAVWRLAAKAKETADRDVEFVRKAIAEQMKELGIESGRCAGVDISVIKAQEKGNVSWAKAYKALSQQTGERVDEDQYRGKPTAGYVRVSEAKE